ncbi:MAG: TIM barrel protein [Flavobacteriaceae bacterium]|nr:TIM barrel protein [Flavobacteriaceae bacterium]
MKRRKFILDSIKTSAIISTFGIASCNNISKPRKPEKIISSKSNQDIFKLSLAQWSIHKQIKNETISPYDFASIARKWKFEGLEYVSDLYGISKSKNPNKELEKFIKISNEEAKKNNLQNLLIMIDDEGDLSTKSKKTRDKAISNHYKWIHAASAMGCHSIRINLFGSNDPLTWQENSKESLKTLCEYAAPYKINILVENHGRLSSNASLLIEVITDVDLPNCGTLPDFGNFCLSRDYGRIDSDCTESYDKYKGIDELLPKAFAVSAKSYDFNKDGHETSIDYERMLQMVKDSGYKGFIGVEYEGDRLSEKEGSIATKNLILKSIKNLI